MKLTVSQPGDQYEQEADRVANAVMHQEQQGSAGSSQAQSIHRQMPEEEEDKMQPKLSNDSLQRQAIPEEEEESMGGGAVQKQALPTEEKEEPAV